MENIRHTIFIQIADTEFREKLARIHFAVRHYVHPVRDREALRPVHGRLLASPDKPFHLFRLQCRLIAYPYIPYTRIDTFQLFDQRVEMVRRDVEREGVPAVLVVVREAGGKVRK